jgi:prepilin-type N-terminal cleavage/methylation domain-containing protein
MHVTRRGDDGVTLIELLIVMILISIIGGIVTTTLVGAMRGTRQQQNRTFAVAAIQTQLERMSRDIRVADPIRAASASALTVDLYKGTGCVRRSWAISGTSLVVTSLKFAAWSSCAVYPAAASPAPTTTVSTALYKLGNGTTPLFTYTDGVGTALGATPTASQIGNIAISLVQSVPEGRAAPTFTTSVGVKNATIR